MVTMFDGSTVFKIASACVVAGAILGVYLSHKTRKFFRKHNA